LGLRPRDTSVVIQAKYSARPEAYPIRPPELKAIALAMAKHSIAVKRQTGRVAGRFLLVTNRELSPPAHKLLKDSSTRGSSIPSGWKRSGAWTALKKTRFHLTTDVGEGLDSVCRFGASLGAHRDACKGSRRLSTRAPATRRKGRCGYSRSGGGLRGIIWISASVLRAHSSNRAR
jgi:hypothetical protein